LETTQGLRRLTDVAKEANLAAVVIHDATIPLISQLGLSDEVSVVNVSTLPSTLQSTALAPPKVELEHEAMVIYTSGSTGVPKVCFSVFMNSLLELSIILGHYNISSCGSQLAKESSTSLAAVASNSTPANSS
jgi:acyl-coenzyme A synthetase/AMP-(fatty) acid ligase